MNANAKNTQSEQPAFTNDINLWMAVLDQAVRDYVALEQCKTHPDMCDDPDFQYEYESLQEWFDSSAIEPGSFQWICQVARLDPNKTLKRLKLYLRVGLIPSPAVQPALEEALELV